MKTGLLFGLLIISLATTVIINFTTFRFELQFDLDPESINRTLDGLSLAYISSYIFYFIVVDLKAREDRKVLYPFIADNIYLMMNNASAIGEHMRDKAKINYDGHDHSIYKRVNSELYPTRDDIKKIGKEVNPNAHTNPDLGMRGFKTIPHLFGLMLKFSYQVDYHLDLILDKATFIDIELLKIISNIKTSRFHIAMMEYDKDQILTAKHRHDNLEAHVRGLNEYFKLFRQLEEYSEKNLQKYVQRVALKVTKEDVIKGDVPKLDDDD